VSDDGEFEITPLDPGVMAGTGGLEAERGLTPLQREERRRERQRLRMEQLRRRAEEAYAREMEMLRQGGNDPCGREAWVNLMRRAGRY